MKPIFIAALLALGVGGCTKTTNGTTGVTTDTDSDGVPKVADYQHPHDADGQAMTGMQFVTRYCQDKYSNQTCLGVDKQRIHDERHRPVPGLNNG